MKFKQLLSVVLSVIILTSTFVVGTITASAATNLPEKVSEGKTSDGWTYCIEKK